MSKRVRPWDKKHRVQEPLFKRTLESARDDESESNDNGDYEVPHIIVNDVRYYSDRFYLNRTCFDDDDDDDNTISPSNGGGSCQCGAMCPPPLFDPGQLVASLDLKAAIFGTYTMEPAWLQGQFPSLFSPDSTVPTLVMHGQRGWKANDNQYDRADADEYATDSQAMGEEQQQEDALYTRNMDHNLGRNRSNFDIQEDELSVGTQNEATTNYADSIKIPPTPEKSKSIPSTLREYGRQQQQQQALHSISFPNSVHFTECTTTWLAPQHIPPSLLASKLLQDDGTLVESVLKNRRYKPGVHHPKFALLFETSGALVIWISTANLTHPVSTDGTWIQRFHPKKKNDASIVDDKDAGVVVDDNNAVENDFAHVLADFLFHETCAARAGQMTALGFLRRYCADLFDGGGRTTIKRSFLNQHFDFAPAQVYLIPTVPGEYNENNKQKYGRRKVQVILEKLTQGKRPWLPSAILTPQDRLIFQPTSLGAQWCPKSLADVVQSYMMIHSSHGQNNKDNNNRRSVDDSSLLKQLDIIWPTREFVAKIHHSLKGRRSSPASVWGSDSGLATTPTSPDIKDNHKTANTASTSESVLATEQVNQGFLFLSSETFNSIHIDCLSSMAMFETSDPPQRPLTLIPHFKSVARLYNGGNHYRVRKEYGVARSTECFSWFLMTSACLSRGAQGHHCHDDAIANNRSSSSSSRALVERSSGSEKVSVLSFSNFELGVMFCSRLQGMARSDRLYCWKPSQCEDWCPKARTTCSAHQSRGRSRLIHLPLPYSVRSPPYQQLHDDDEDDDHAEFCETPYFHEIPPGTGCIGNMRLTPHGESLAMQQDLRSNFL